MSQRTIPAPPLTLLGVLAAIESEACPGCGSAKRAGDVLCPACRREFPDKVVTITPLLRDWCNARRRLKAASPAGMSGARTFQNPWCREAGEKAEDQHET